jgi:uncharacterized protein
MAAAHREGTDLLIELRIQPRAGDEGFAGLHGGRLRVRLKAPPVDGRANAALVTFLAGSFDVPRNHIAIERGHASRDKRVRVRGVPPLGPTLAGLLGCN